jgi:hypothetical protein
MTVTRNALRQQPRADTGWVLWLLYICDAGLLAASGLIHLHLWDIAYRHVHVLNVLFHLQLRPGLHGAGDRGPGDRVSQPDRLAHAQAVRK